MKTMVEKVLSINAQAQTDTAENKSSEQVCNYSNNYYADQACLPPPKSEEE